MIITRLSARRPSPYCWAARRRAVAWWSIGRASRRPTFTRSAISRAITDLRAVLKGLLRDHLRVEDRVLAADVFPGSDGAQPMVGLLA